MTDHIDDAAARLELNARPFRHDAALDPIADAMDRGDTAAWQNLHPLVVDRASIYRDFRTQSNPRTILDFRRAKALTPSGAKELAPLRRLRT